MGREIGSFVYARGFGVSDGGSAKVHNIFFRCVHLSASPIQSPKSTSCMENFCLISTSDGGKVS